jgi:predicted metal-binding membrane protein
MQSVRSLNNARAKRTPARLALLVAAPVGVALASWIYLGLMISDMSAIPGMSAMMMYPKAVTPMILFGLFLMWAIMMAAMMLPTAAPMILAYTRMQASDRNRGASWWPVAAFSGGYVMAWAAFSLAAAIAQAGLTNLSLMSPMMMKMTAPLASGTLIIAGLYQFSPLKQSCLQHCRTPMSFLLTQWREGAWGALGMGWRHGLFCVGCCWALMGLLFVVGVMNTAWIVAITIYVLIEKIVPRSEVLSKLVGTVMVGLGIWIAV